MVGGRDRGKGERMGFHRICTARRANSLNTKSDNFSQRLIVAEDAVDLPLGKISMSLLQLTKLV